MRLTARARGGALAALIAAVAMSCGLINPLDHLQSGADAAADAPNTPVGDGETPGGDGGIVQGSVDADNAPGCGPPDWKTCGVTTVATPTLPGDAVFALASIFFTDEGTGEVFETTCKSDSCTQPELRVTGEDKPRRMAYVQDSVFWTTATAIRRFRFSPDAATPVETLDTIEGEAQITGKYPHAVWTDAKGVRGWPLYGGIVTLWGKPSTSPTIGLGEAHMFVSEGEVKRVNWGATGVGSVSAVPGSTGAALVVWNFVAGNFLTGLSGTVAAVPDAGGSRLVLLDQLDDAGASFVLDDEAAAVVSIDSDRELNGSSDTHIWWTNAAGELRRRAKDAPGVTTMLRGLSSDTRIDVKDRLVLITDRGGKRILSYSP